MHKINDWLWQTGTARNPGDGPPNATVIRMDLMVDDNDQGLSPEVFSRVVEFLRAIPRGDTEHPVVTVCTMGENRSGLASVVLLVLSGLPVVEAISLVREKVPPITNQPYAFWNPGFVRQVTEWANSLEVQ